MFSALLLAVDDGVVHGDNTFADIMFLIAAVLFALGTVIALQVKTFYAALIAAGLCLVSVGWFVL